MAIDSVSAADTANSSTKLNLQDFMRILITQLSNQDPLKPMDNTEFMAQLAQFTSLEQTRELNEKLGALLATQATAQSIGLIGRTVDVKGDSGPLSGQVTLLDLSGSEPRLTVKQASGALVDGISLSQITAVH